MNLEQETPPSQRKTSALRAVVTGSYTKTSLGITRPPPNGVGLHRYELERIRTNRFVPGQDCLTRQGISLTCIPKNFFIEVDFIFILLRQLEFSESPLLLVYQLDSSYLLFEGSQSDP